MKKCLIDAGPMIALFNRDDKYHKSMVNFIKSYNGMLISTWPVVSEVCYMLSSNYSVQTDFLTWIKKGAVQLYTINKISINRIIELILKYDDIPMDMADASLLAISEESNMNEIISIDSDFNIYRKVDGSYIKNIFQPEADGR